ncbi:hypothetical protein JCM10212_001434 [Sporobolomyces blumeae]
MVRPPPGLVTSIKEAAGRAFTTSSKGGASKLIRPGLKFQRPIQGHPRTVHSGTASSSSPSAVQDFLHTIYQGVFHSVRSAAIPRAGPYTGQRLAARPSPVGPPRGFSSAARPRPAPSRFGPTPRPVLVRPGQTSHVGLGAARTFSSSGFAVFENVVANAPLALRALADQGLGLDDRKWNRIRREVRRQEKTDVKGKGAIEGQRFKENIDREFAQFFSVVPTATRADVTKVEEPLSLFLVLDPEVSFASASTTPSSSSSALDRVEFDPSYRLLPPSVLVAFDQYTQSYTSHGHRLRALVNRLSAAGLLDDPSAHDAGLHVDVESGKRIWKIVFRDAFLTRSRLEDVLRGSGVGARSTDMLRWQDKVENWEGARLATSTGEGIWWWISGGDPSVLGWSGPSDGECVSPSSSPLSDSRPLSLASSISSSRSPTPPAHSFLLPDPTLTSSRSSSSTVSSLELSPPLSPSLEPTDWTSYSLDSGSTRSFGITFDGPDVEDLDAIESWSNGFGDESDDSASTSDLTWSSEGDARLEDDMDGVQQFLDEIERERKRIGGSQGWH